MQHRLVEDQRGEVRRADQRGVERRDDVRRERAGDGAGSLVFISPFSTIMTLRGC